MIKNKDYFDKTSFFVDKCVNNLLEWKDGIKDFFSIAL
jgi:hypothetical protein